MGVDRVVSWISRIRGWRVVARIRKVGRVGWAKTTVFTAAPAVAAFAVFRYQQGSAQAAGMASGISALVAITAAVYVLHPRLNCWLLPSRVRKRHNEHVAWLTLAIGNVRFDLNDSRGRAGSRADALRILYIASRSIPGAPPSPLDIHFPPPAELANLIAGYREVAEGIVGSRDRPLEDPRLVYQLNLTRALSRLLGGVVFELGGHGYVTDLWKQNLEEWVICAQRQYRALRRPLGPSANEDQLLNLLDRMHTHGFDENSIRSLQAGDLVRTRVSEAEWTGTLKLTADPVVVGYRDTGLPVWRLEVVDVAGAEASFINDRQWFEPAPSG